MPKFKRDPLVNAQKVGNFLDIVIEKRQLKNDASLARLLELPPPILSKLRHGRLNFTAYHVLKFHKATGLAVNDIMAATGFDLSAPE
jgi:plasmid maintenance system antidote protein VapI